MYKLYKIQVCIIVTVCIMFKNVWCRNYHLNVFVANFVNVSTAGLALSCRKYWTMLVRLNLCVEPLSLLKIDLSKLTMPYSNEFHNEWLLSTTPYFATNTTVDEQLIDSQCPLFFKSGRNWLCLTLMKTCRFSKEVWVRWRNVCFKPHVHLFTFSQSDNKIINKNENAYFYDLDISFYCTLYAKKMN